MSKHGTKTSSLLPIFNVLNNICQVSCLITHLQYFFNLSLVHYPSVCPIHPTSHTFHRPNTMCNIIIDILTILDCKIFKIFSLENSLCGKSYFHIYFIQCNTKFELQTSWSCSTWTIRTPEFVSKPPTYIINYVLRCK